MSLLSCKDLVIKYENTTVISNLSFSVEYGDFLCIVGDNGAGKSTLMKVLLGLKQYSSGSVEYDHDFKRNEIGYVSQLEEIDKDFPAGVREVIMQGCLNKHGLLPFYTAAEKQRADEVLKKLHIESLAEQSYSELSGGQRKRVLLARALMASGRLLLLDEPVAALDPIATRDFYDTLNKLHKEGMTIIMVSHDIHASIHHGTHILHLSHDIPTFIGTVDEYLNSKAGHAYLDEKGKCAQCDRNLHEHMHGISKKDYSILPISESGK